ncbi:MAG: tetraacyldisaccharide 4'-kinase [Rickettsiales bacterium]|nr:tetraacyldisaccharide 4'-kinase [Rickettsiales bacterium]
MSFKTPKFWLRKNIISVSLLPLSFIYRALAALDKSSKKTIKITKPVICVGNLIAGGSGKTPTAIAIGKILYEIFKDDKEFQFAYLSRGYKGKGYDFLSLREGHYQAKEVGDEALLLNEMAPTFVAKNRQFGAKQIDKTNKIKAIVLDDGMQNKTLHKDLTITVVDGQIAFGNEFLIPAGPLRQSIKSGLAESDLMVVIGKTKEGLIKKLFGKKIIHANLVATNLDKFRSHKLIAFCGLGYPEKFFSFLRDQGLNVIDTGSFPDHHNYQPHELENLCEIAKKANSKLITTKKDWIKFPKIFQEKIDYLEVELEFLDKKIIEGELKRLIRF